MTDDLKERARAFADRWHGRGDENADTQQYWLDLLEHVLHVPDVMDRDVCRFEARTAAPVRQLRASYGGIVASGVTRRVEPEAAEYRETLALEHAHTGVGG